GRGGQCHKHPEVTVAVGAFGGGQRRVPVADVAVDGAHDQARRGDRGGDVVDGALVEHVWDVVADPGQCAQVDLGEAEAADGLEGLGQRLVPEADRRATQAGVE